MKNLFILSIILVLFRTSFGQNAVKIWETDTVFKVPESVLFNDTVIYVSNVNGPPDEKNEMGFISRMNKDRKVLQLKWITGLNAPKGMGILKEKLYVTDIDRVVVIDRKKGKVLKYINVPESVFLNDIAVSEFDMVAVSDMMTNTIHFIQDDQLVSMIKDEKFNRVNGLCWDGNMLFAGTVDIIFRVDVKAKKAVPFIQKTGAIDGLEIVNKNTFVVSDWAGKVQIVSTEHAPKVLFDTTKEKNAADLDFDSIENVIYAPTFFGNTVSVYKIIK